MNLIKKIYVIKKSKLLQGNKCYEFGVSYVLFTNTSKDSYGVSVFLFY